MVGAEVVVVAHALPHAALGRGGPGLEAARALVVEPRARLQRDPRDLLVHVPLVEALRSVRQRLLDLGESEESGCTYSWRNMSKHHWQLQRRPLWPQSEPSQLFPYSTPPALMPACANSPMRRRFWMRITAESPPFSVGTPAMMTGFIKASFRQMSLGGWCAPNSPPEPSQSEQPTVVVPCWPTTSGSVMLASLAPL